jgi:aspartate carbamoyltransferase catalytic subunit
MLGIEPLSAEQIVFLLDQSKPFQEIQRHPLKKLATLRGKTVALAFLSLPRARASALPPRRLAWARTR